MQRQHRDIQLTDITANDMTFHCRTAGNRGEAVILLHGFPETSHMWEPLMVHLLDRGYQCIAPDQRGYSPGARPHRVEDYGYQKLTDDVLAIADVMSVDRFHLIGHDHGAGVGWTLVHDHPERVLSWTALSVPHLAAFGKAIREDQDQRERSQYINFFQLPGDAESALSDNHYAALREIWTASNDSQKQAYLSVFSQQGALQGALNWYRGALRTEGEDATTHVGAINTPSLCIWGNRDSAIGRRCTELAGDYMLGPYRFIEADAGHWLMQEVPELVIEEVTVHLAAWPDD